MSTPATHSFFQAATGQSQPFSASSSSFRARVAPLPTRITRYRMTAEQVPVDFFADPDGSWEFSSLVEMAGFNPEHPGASVGALTQPFDGFPEGSAVITEVGVDCRYVAVAQLPAVSSSGAVSPSDAARSAADNRGVAAARSLSAKRPHRAA
jgi:hypothetical protein